MLRLKNVIVPAGVDIAPLAEELEKEFGEEYRLVSMAATPAMLPPSLKAPQGEAAVIYSFAFQDVRPVTMKTVS